MSLYTTDSCILCGHCIDMCPFGAIAMKDDKIEFSSACKMCRICVDGCPVSAIKEEEVVKKAIDKSKWRDILVYVEHDGKDIHPVTYELIGKAKELASVTRQRVHCLMIGHEITDLAKELLEYGVDEVDVYDDEALKYFRSDAYKNVFVHCIDRRMPNTVLVGATVTGRSLAPRVAAYFKTGLTADCTILQMREDTDLVQIRPAFGGNIMAQILNTSCRPQFATVRYKVMERAKKVKATGHVAVIDASGIDLSSKITIKEVIPGHVIEGIEEAEMIFAVGRGASDEKTIAKIEDLASKLGAQIACTRPLVEAGRWSVMRQIGLSGRSVRPKLIMTFGVSGAIQFTAGMQDSEKIIAIDIDPEAPIFKVAHVAVIADVKVIVDKLLATVKELTDV